MQVEAAVCAFCGCLCDDIELTIEGDAITRVKNACALGNAWFLNQGNTKNLPQARVDGRYATMEEGIEAAAEILRSAKYPLICGLGGTSCEAQKIAIELAETLGGCIDGGALESHGPLGMAMQNIGEQTCSLGEVKNRADLVIFWGVDPSETHPRLMERYAVSPVGMLVPNGKKDRTVIFVDVRPTPGFTAADLTLLIRPGKDFEIFWTLLALVKGKKITPEAIEELGVTLEQLTDLADRMKSCRYGVLFHGQGLAQSAGKFMNAAAVSLLVQELNTITKFALVSMRGQGNETGIDNVMTWQTGYPFGVNFSKGYPRYNPGEYTMADVLSRNEADAVLAVASDPMVNLPSPAKKRLAEIPLIAIAPNENETTRAARVSFATAKLGIGAAGTAFRMDGIPLFLPQTTPSRSPSDEEILGCLLARVKEGKA